LLAWPRIRLQSELIKVFLTHFSRNTTLLKIKVDKDLLRTPSGEILIKNDKNELCVVASSESANKVCFHEVIQMPGVFFLLTAHALDVVDLLEQLPETILQFSLVLDRCALQDFDVMLANVAYFCNRVIVIYFGKDVTPMDKDGTGAESVTFTQIKSEISKFFDENKNVWYFPGCEQYKGKTTLVHNIREVLEPTPVDTTPNPITTDINNT